jgi:hypothetical protein
MFGANRIAASTATTARFVCRRQLRSYHRLMLRRPHQTGANQLYPDLEDERHATTVAFAACLPPRLSPHQSLRTENTNRRRAAL